MYVSKRRYCQQLEHIYTIKRTEKTEDRVAHENSVIFVAFTILNDLEIVRICTTGRIDRIRRCLQIRHFGPLSMGRSEDKRVILGGCWVEESGYGIEACMV